MATPSLNVKVVSIPLSTNKGTVEITGTTITYHRKQSIALSGTSSFTLLPGDYTLDYQPPSGYKITGVVEVVKVKNRILQTIDLFVDWFKGLFV